MTMDREQETCVLNRRGFLAGTATIAATGTFATAVLAAAEPDPVFALMEQERVLWDAYGDAISFTSEAEEAFYDLRARDEGASQAALDLKRVVRERYALQHEAGERASDALLDVMSATPTTAAGLLAMMDLFWDRQRDFISEPMESYLEGLFSGVRAVVGPQPTAGA